MNEIVQADLDDEPLIFSFIFINFNFIIKKIIFDNISSFSKQFLTFHFINKVNCEE